MNVHDYATRQEQRAKARESVLCPDCQHPTGEHFELPYSTFSVKDGVAVEALNPEHEAGVFHCQHEGCRCKVRA